MNTMSILHMKMSQYAIETNEEQKFSTDLAWSIPFFYHFRFDT